MIKRIIVDVLLIATFSFTSDFTELMAGSCSLLPKLMKTRSKLAGLGRPHINCHSLGPTGTGALGMLNGKCSSHTFNGKYSRFFVETVGTFTLIELDLVPPSLSFHVESSTFLVQIHSLSSWNSCFIDFSNAVLQPELVETFF